MSRPPDRPACVVNVTISELGGPLDGTSGHTFKENIKGDWMGSARRSVLSISVCQPACVVPRLNVGPNLTGPLSLLDYYKIRSGTRREKSEGPRRDEKKK